MPAETMFEVTEPPQNGGLPMRSRQAAKSRLPCDTGFCAR